MVAAVYVLSLVLACVARPAEPELPGAAAVLARVDVDRDGQLSPREYASVDDAEGFREIDTNRDGAITRTELGDWLALAEPRPEDQIPDPRALIDALTTPAAVEAAVAPAKAAAKRGKAPKPDPSVLLLSGLAVTWALAWLGRRGAPS